MNQKQGTLDYDELVAQYNHGLLVQLRGFKPAGNEFLDTWVPDEDPNRSLLNLVDAAQLEGVDSLTIRISPATFAKVDLGSLLRELSQLGEAVLSDESDHFALRVENMVEVNQFKSCPTFYRTALLKLSQTLTCSGALEPHPGLDLVSGQDGKHTLSLCIDPVTHTIKKARFQTSEVGPVTGVFEQLCRILVGMPVQEASDHALLKVEFSCRGTGARPVEGILTPDQTPQLFHGAMLLVRRLVEQYRRQHRLEKSINFFAAGATAAWNELTHDQREKKVREEIRDLAPKVGLDPEALCLASLEDDVKVTLRFVGDGISSEKKAKSMMDLERELKKTVDSTLLVFQEERSDLNSKRRL